MQREAAYNIGRDVSRFIDTLRENDFDYTEATKSIVSQTVNGPRLARLLRDVENYVIISTSPEEKPNIKVLRERKRLVELLEKL